MSKSDAAPNIYAQYAATLEKTEWGTRAEIENYRNQLLRRLITFAFNNSPFYRSRLQSLFRDGQVPELKAWPSIPILRRADLENAIDQINPADVPADVGPVTVRRTSGTTGQRIEIRTCALAQIAAEAMMHRMYRWHRFDLSASMASIRLYGSGHRSYPDGITEDLWCHAGPPARHYTLDLRHPTDQLIEWLVRRKPKYLLTFPSIAYDIAQHADAQLVANLQLAKIVSISELVTAHTREAVHEKLGCEIAQIYACGEMGCIGLQSPADDQLLVCEESVLVELVDEAGDPVRVGEPGRVILTSLYNYATPLIRYEIGDYATWCDDPCPTGRTLLRLQRVNGRKRNVLVKADGSLLWSHQVPETEFIRHLATPHFQIRQIDASTLDVMYVPKVENSSVDKQSIAALLGKLLGGPVNVRTHAVDQIARSSGGKRELIVSMMV